MSHPARIKFWSRMADLIGLGKITWRPDDEGGWFCFGERVGVPHVARGSTGADALKELVLFARRVR